MKQIIFALLAGLTLTSISSCKKQGTNATVVPTEEKMSSADSIANTNAHLAFMDIYLGEVFQRKQWSKEHGIDCSEEGSEQLTNIFRKYRFLYLPQQLRVTINTLPDNTVYEIEVNRVDGIAQEVWDSCHKVLGSKYAKNIPLNDLMKTRDVWEYKNQIVIMNRNANLGSENLCINYIDKEAHKKMEQIRDEAKAKGQVVY